MSNTVPDRIIESQCGTNAGNTAYSMTAIGKWKTWPWFVMCLAGCSQHDAKLPLTAQANEARKGSLAAPLDVLPFGPLPFASHEVRRVLLSSDNALLCIYHVRPDKTGMPEHNIVMWDCKRNCSAASRTVPGEIGSLCFSPSGSHLAVSCLRGAVELWTTPVCRTVAVSGMPELRSNRVYCMAFSRSGQQLALGCTADDPQHHCLACVFDMTNGRLTVVGAMNAIPSRVMFAGGGSMLAAADSRGHVIVWNLCSRTVYWDYDTPAHPVTKRIGIRGFADHPDGARLVTVGLDSIVRVSDINQRKIVTSFPANVIEVEDLALSPDGNVLAIAGTNEVLFVQANTGVLLWKCGPMDNHVSSVCFSADGKAFVVGSYWPQGTVSIWPVPNVSK